jgi:hypothetical protein
MSLADWLRSFRVLHGRARSGSLAPGELAGYRAGRDELARAMLAAQQVMMKPGELPRRQLRAARALQVDLDFGKDKMRAVTLDVSAGGFGAFLARAPVPGDPVRISLRIPDQEPIACVARVVDVKVLPGNARAAFAFTGLSADEVERLETFVFDCVLDQLP